MNRQGPTTQERMALERIKALPTRSVLVVVAMVGPMLFHQLLPERFAAVSAIVSVGLVLGLFATLVHQACFLRCPRCAGWIALPKCPACGLKLDDQHERHRPINRTARRPDGLARLAQAIAEVDGHQRPNV